MAWRKLGRCFVPSGELWWARSYATIPTAEVLDGEKIRVYFASLDEKNYGRIGFVDVSTSDPTKIVGQCREPVLDIGPLGAFDDCGVNASCVISNGSKKLMYYIGWQRCERTPYMLFTGLAVNNGSGSDKFSRVQPTPILDRIPSEPYSRSAPCVIKHNGEFLMWYWTCLEWTMRDGKPHYNNVIKAARSSNGINWSELEGTCLTPNTSFQEYSVGRPWVVVDGRKWKMWFSARSFQKLYTIGYAESDDGIVWNRMDNSAGLAPSASGWDSDMTCYPCVVNVDQCRYMFYNGNRHGQSGFGCAVWEK